MKGYRTLLVNFLMAILPILELSELVDVMPREWLPWYSLGMALVNMYLRYVTTTAVGKSE